MEHSQKRIATIRMPQRKGGSNVVELSDLDFTKLRISRSTESILVISSAHRLWTVISMVVEAWCC